MAWKFNSTNSTSNAVLGALLNKTTVCLPSGAVWAPYLNTGTRAYCGNGGEGGCKAFYYTNGTCNGKGNTGWGIEFDGDTGCASAASVSYTHLDVYKRQEGKFGSGADCVTIRESISAQVIDL